MIRCWERYGRSEKAVTDWLNQAEAYAREGQPVSKAALETQKQFFQRVDEAALKEFQTAAQDLFKCLPPQQQVLFFDMGGKVKGSEGKACTDVF